ncbi:hypothetical protein L6452_02112 [Arctium lappa]|uniref:Uncharacterized protein n=1 Tax=Arctium lappa TaxID=4217 RepID=A0ACB9FHZ7_ARCLA|nr:hypothetical protein L6452_02112 [Arctium lappa]
MGDLEYRKQRFLFWVQGLSTPSDGGVNFRFIPYALNAWQGTLHVAFTDWLWKSDFGRHAFGRIMNSVVDRVVVTSRLLFVQQLRLRFSYEHLLTRDLSSEITLLFTSELSAITE